MFKKFIILPLLGYSNLACLELILRLDRNISGSSQEAGRIPYLPDEIILQILAYVPDLPTMFEIHTKIIISNTIGSSVAIRRP